jgi:hypothetical protein
VDHLLGMEGGDVAGVVSRIYGLGSLHYQPVPLSLLVKI